MDRKNKNIFLEALLLTLLLFLIGILIGVLFEQQRVDKIEEYYIQSEVSLMDIFAFNNFVDLNMAECAPLVHYNVNFANRIYEEAKLLEKYEDSGKISDDLEAQHAKYDVMRTLLWINTMKADNLCGNNIHTVVYLYEYNPDDLTQRAVNSVWSKILSEVKAIHGDDLILIPIAVNSDIVALNAILENYEIASFPALVIDNEEVITELSTVEEVETYLI